MSDEELKKVANEVRKGIVTGVHAAKSGHPGGSLGAADIMTYLYFEEMNVDPADPRKADRDRFVLSKGHCAPGLYAVLAERGFFPKEDLETLRHIGSHLQGHPNMNDTPGVDMSTGSLGQGISPPPWVWPLPPSTGAILTARTPCWAMARARRARSGRPPCLPATSSSITSA